MGEGLGAVWARRALEREGYQVHQGPNGSGVQVQVLNDNGRIGWQLTQNNQTALVDSIQALLESLTRDS
jgi:iron complex transport system ATP-binding protein